MKKLLAVVFVTSITNLTFAAQQEQTPEQVLADAKKKAYKHKHGEGLPFTSLPDDLACRVIDESLQRQHFSDAMIRAMMLERRKLGAENAKAQTPEASDADRKDAAAQAGNAPTHAGISGADAVKLDLKVDPALFKPVISDVLDNAIARMEQGRSLQQLANLMALDSAQIMGSAQPMADQSLQRSGQQIANAMAAQVAAIPNRAVQEFDALLQNPETRAQLFPQVPASDADRKDAAAQAGNASTPSQVELKEAAAHVPAVTGILDRLDAQVAQMTNSPHPTLPGALGAVDFQTFFIKGDVQKQLALTRDAVKALATDEKTKPFMVSCNTLLAKLLALQPEIEECAQHLPAFVQGCQKNPQAQQLYENLAPRIKLLAALKQQYEKQSFSSAMAFFTENPEVAKEAGIELPKSVLEAQERARKQAEQVTALNQGQQAMQAQLTQLLELMKVQNKQA